MNPSPKVLLVEDDTLLAESLGERLRTEGFTLAVAKSAEEAIDIVADTVPDLIVTDVILPGMDGIAMIAKIHGNPETSQVPVIILSNNDDAATLAEAVAQNLTTYLIKSDHGLDSIIAEVKKALAAEKPTQ